MEGPRKRQLELDELYEDEDNFDTESTGIPRRGRKEGRRVSGVYREIKSLQNIGGNATVLSRVFQRLTIKEMMLAGSISSMWYITACQEMRRRYGNAPFLRLWNYEQRMSKYLWINWELHFHEQLLASSADSSTEDTSMDLDVPFNTDKGFSCIDSIISIGSRNTFQQFVHDDAKLPIRQDHIFLTCANAIMTTPDLSKTDIIENIFSWNQMAVQSFFIPKSKNVSLKAFSLESDVDAWELDQVKSKVEFPAEDVGEGQDLRAVLCVHWTQSGPTMSFVETFKNNYRTTAFLSGFAEEIGSNRCTAAGSPMAVGFSIYAGSGAIVSVYEIDFEKESSVAVLDKMAQQAKLFPLGFCFVFSHDTRNWIEIKDEEANDEEDWSTSVPNESKVEGILSDLRKRMPKIPIFGVNSWPTVTAETIDKSHSNVLDDSNSHLHYGFLMVNYE